MVIAIDADSIGKEIDSLGDEVPREVKIVSGALQVMQTRGWTITADLEGKSLLTVNAETASEEAAAIPLSTEQVRWNANKQDFPALMKLIPPKAQGLRPLLDSLIKGVSMKQDGVSLKVNISMPEGLDQLPELLRPLLNRVRETTELARSKSTLIQCMIAIHNSFDTHAVLPVAGGPGFESDKTKPGLLSWRVHLLPQLGSYSLYKQFHLDEPWDSKHNSQFIKKMPKVLGDDPSVKTTFHIFIGKGTPFGGKLRIKLRDVTDGHSNVIGVVEAGPDKAEIWTKPGACRLTRRTRSLRSVTSATNSSPHFSTVVSTSFPGQSMPKHCQN